MRHRNNFCCETPKDSGISLQDSQFTTKMFADGARFTKMVTLFQAKRLTASHAYLWDSTMQAQVSLF
jgi:hypothetical protein